MSRQQQLMEMVVGNFLNIFAVSAIILLLIILTLGFTNHFRSNKNVDRVKIQERIL